MADVLPQLKLPSGEWIRPQVDGYSLGHRWGVTVSDAGDGVPFTRRPRDDQPLPISFSFNLETVEHVRWWALWFYRETLNGARRFEALLPLANGDRYCVCELANPPEQQDSRTYRLVLKLTVNVISESATPHG